MLFLLILVAKKYLFCSAETSDCGGGTSLTRELSTTGLIGRAAVTVLLFPIWNTGPLVGKKERTIDVGAAGRSLSAVGHH